jgi:hypothetical protein
MHFNKMPLTEIKRLLFTVSRDKLSDLARPSSCALSELLKYNMNCCERKYIVVSSCDKQILRISAYDIHKHIYSIFRQIMRT